MKEENHFIPNPKGLVNMPNDENCNNNSIRPSNGTHMIFHGRSYEGSERWSDIQNTDVVVPLVGQGSKNHSLKYVFLSIKKSMISMIHI